MTKTIEELLSESKELRLSFRKNDSAPVGNPVVPIELPWVRDFFQVLAPVGYQVTDLIIHWYLPEIGDVSAFKEINPPEMGTEIIHGHTREGFCCASTLCHVLGFKLEHLESVPSHFNNSWKRFGYGNS